jgi:hypothetical protein
VPNDLTTYLAWAGIAFLFIVALWKLLLILGRPPRPTVRSLEEKADVAGAAGSEKEEKRVKAIFDDFRQKENLK